MENPYLSMLWSAFGQALPYLVFLAAFVIALKLLEAKFSSKPRGRKWRGDRRDWRQRGDKVLPFQPRHDALPDRVPDAADQLRTVMKADFKPQALLNKGEARLFKVLDKMVTELAPPGWQVMAQVSLGEILRCADANAFRCINSKRVDLLIVDADCNPLHAIEYQGGGHFNGAHATAARDAVKKEALRRADIGYDEILAGLSRSWSKGPAHPAISALSPSFAITELYGSGRNLSATTRSNDAFACAWRNSCGGPGTRRHTSPSAMG